MDFEAGDRLTFSRAGLDPTLSPGTPGAAYFVCGANAVGAGAGAEVLVCTLTGAPGLTLSDLLIIA